MNFPTITTVEEFVAWEELQDERYEFSDGKISLVPGASVRHEIIVPNIIIALRRVAPPEAVRSSGVKQLTDSSSRYADVSVTFDERDSVDLTYSKFPTLLVEILSPSTHRVDRVQKAKEYKTLETLREYVLVDSRKRWVQTIRRSGDIWIESLPSVAGSIHLESLGLTVALDEIYAGTKL
jgi:Uma2 family endonuclease